MAKAFLRREGRNGAPLRQASKLVTKKKVFLTLTAHVHVMKLLFFLTDKEAK
jgi:hypothetical protein